jgi:hypothetical protein
MAAYQRNGFASPDEPPEKHGEILQQSEHRAGSNDEEKSIGAEPHENHLIDEDGERHYTEPAETPKDLITEVIHVTDDPSLNPWTFRVWFLGKSAFIY